LGSVIVRASVLLAWIAASSFHCNARPVAADAGTGAGDAADGGDAGAACGASFACPAPGTTIDCMPVVPPALATICGNDCAKYVTEHCPGVSFTY